MARIFTAHSISRLLWVCISIVLCNTGLRAQCISTFPYNEGFEASAAWTAGGNASSWAWGTQSHPTISSAGGGSKSWCTGGLTGSAYNGNQSSWLQSPCFNFSSLSYPWISFKIFWECENIWDGMVLQYSTNNGGSWNNVGDFSDPVNCLNVNWYNSSNISNLQASPRQGWCGRIGATSGACTGGGGSAGWVTAKHSMPALANQPNVIFRFLFGAGTSCNSFDGIAIDDILVQDAPPNAANFSYACAPNNGANFTNMSALCPTSFSWNFGDPGSGAANTSSAQNPSHTFSSPGVYNVTLTVTGPYNAPSTTVMPVSIMSVTTAVTNLTCNGAGNGGSAVTASGGAPAYSYTWLPTGGNGPVASGLQAGNYTVQVADANNCIVTRVANITQPPAMTAVISQTDVSCFGANNGALSATASLGVAPYTYTWTPPGIASYSIANLSPGNYSLTVKDANGCTSKFSALVKEPMPLTVTLNSLNVSCFGSNNGTITALVNGGTLPYSYTWSPSPASSPGITGLGPGTYSIAIKDAHGCFTSSTAVITQPAAPLIGSILTRTPTCGQPNGSATVTPAGGTPGYSYQWLPSGGNAAIASGLNGGNYSVNITDNNGCITTVTVFITPSLPVLLSVFKTDASCSNLANGSAVAMPGGGIAPYTYTWLPGNITGQGMPNATGLAAGSYSVHVKDVNNCDAISLFSIAAPLPLELHYTINNVNCFGGNDGSFSLSASGGTPAYSFSSTSFGSIGTALSNLIAGNYSITLKDNHNCKTDSVIHITQPAILASVFNHADVLCYGQSTGSVSASISGGTPGYTYLWAPTGGNLSSANGLAAGVYSLVLQDAHNCTLISTLTLAQPLQPLAGTVISNTVLCFGGTSGSATLTANGGSPGYAYAWSGSPGIGYSASGLSAGVHSVTITDQHNCSSVVTFSIDGPPLLVVTPVVPKICKAQPAVITVTTNAIALPVTYNWESGVSLSNSVSVTFSSSVNYHVFITDANGCSSSMQSIPVEVPPALEINTGSNVKVCQGENMILGSLPTGGDGNYTVLWQPGNLSGTTQTVSGMPAPSYTVSVTDGCSEAASKIILVTVYPVPATGIALQKNDGCAPVCVSFSNDSLLRSDLIQTYHWTVGDTIISDNPSPSYCYNKPGNHLIQLTYLTINGCYGKRTSAEFIHVDPKPVAQFTTTNEEFDAYNPTAVFVNQSTDAAFYDWQFNNTGFSFEEHPVHTFTAVGEQLIVLTVQNDWGCKDVVAKKINIQPEFTFYIPDSFTPNNDALNDVFKPLGMGWNESKFEMSIFSRWGETMFSTKDTTQGWDGKRNGNEEVQNGVYVWKVEITDMFGGYHKYTGFVSVEH